MEELQSTDILAREILEDARKKAQRILKAANDTINMKSAEWEMKLAVTLDEAEKKYAEQGRLACEEIMTVLPIDKRRAKAKRIEELLNSAVENWYRHLSRSQVLALLKKELASRIAACDTFSGTEAKQKIQVTIHNLNSAETRTILQAVLPGIPFSIEETHSASVFPELVVETHNVRIYASIGKTVDFYLGEKRAELLEALGLTEMAGEGLL